jgi:hypothetical protein
MQLKQMVERTTEFQESNNLVWNERITELNRKGLD